MCLFDIMEFKDSNEAEMNTEDGEKETPLGRRMPLTQLKEILGNLFT